MPSGELERVGEERHGVERDVLGEQRPQALREGGVAAVGQDARAVPGRRAEVDAEHARHVASAPFCACSTSKPQGCRHASRERRTERLSSTMTMRRIGAQDSSVRGGA